MIFSQSEKEAAANRSPLSEILGRTQSIEIQHHGHFHYHIDNVVLQSRHYLRLHARVDFVLLNFMVFGIYLHRLQVPSRPCASFLDIVRADVSLEMEVSTQI